MNFKRKHHRSGMMKKCTICGSQRRWGGNSTSKQLRHKPIEGEKKMIAEQFQ